MLPPNHVSTFPYVGKGETVLSAFLLSSGSACNRCVLLTGIGLVDCFHHLIFLGRKITIYRRNGKEIKKKEHQKDSGW